LVAVPVIAHRPAFPHMVAGAVAGAADIFERRQPGVERQAKAAWIKDLPAKVGELTVERDFLEQGLGLLRGSSAKGMSLSPALGPLTDSLSDSLCSVKSVKSVKRKSIHRPKK